jgi:hypothetical protein
MFCIETMSIFVMLNDIIRDEYKIITKTDRSENSQIA